MTGECHLGVYDKPTADIFHRHTERSYIPQLFLTVRFLSQTFPFLLLHSSSFIHPLEHIPTGSIAPSSVYHLIPSTVSGDGIFFARSRATGERATNKNYTFTKTGNAEVRYGLGKITDTSHLLSSFHFSKPRSHPVQETGAYIIFGVQVSISALTFRFTDYLLCRSIQENFSHEPHKDKRRHCHPPQGRTRISFLATSNQHHIHCRFAHYFHILVSSSQIAKQTHHTPVEVRTYYCSLVCTSSSDLGPRHENHGDY